MRNNKERPNTYSLPAYLAELLRPTPSGVAKLLAAWDGLSVESKIQVLTELPKLQLPQYLHEKVCTKALKSENPYIRYLAAKQFYFRDIDEPEKKDIKKRIEEDPVPLVHHSLSENVFGFPADLSDELRNPEAFFALPHDARLAKVRSLRGSGDTVAKLISYAIDHPLKEGKVSEIEIFEILSDYVNSPQFQEKYFEEDIEALTYDGYAAYLADKDIEALWGLVPKLPEWVSLILIENLPEEVGIRSETPGRIPRLKLIPAKILDAMSPVQLEHLLYRKDIELEELRKKLFWKSAEVQDHYPVGYAAISYNFDLEYEEFANILKRPTEQRIDILAYLSSASDLGLVLYAAIHDVLFSTEATAFGGPWEDAASARNRMEQKIKELSGWQREKQLRELRLYRLDRQAVPWKTSEKGYPPSGELEFLAKSIVEGDTWATFMAFSAAWEKQRCSELEKYLPRIYEIDEDTTDETKVDERQKPDHSKLFTKGDFILYNTQKGVDLWSTVCSISVLVALVFAGSAVYKFFVGEYGSALKSGFVTVIGLVMFKGALGQYSHLRKEQKRVMDEMLE